jgi:hypothetical protein
MPYAYLATHQGKSLFYYYLPRGEPMAGFVEEQNQLLAVLR